MGLPFFLVLVAFVASCKAVTLADLFAGAPIQVGDALLENWVQISNVVTGGDSQNRIVVDPANIDMTIDTTDVFNPALVFTAQANELTILQTGGSPAALTLIFRFDVTITNPAVAFTGVSLTATFSRSPDQIDDAILASVHEILYTDPSISSELGTLDRQMQDADGIVPGPGIDQSGTTDTAFFPQRTSLTIVKDINANAEKTGSSAGTIVFSQNFPLAFVIIPTE